MTTAPRAGFEDHEAAAERVCPDPGDVPYFALAMALDARLWSDDRKLQEQSTVTVVTTTELRDRVA